MVVHQGNWDYVDAIIIQYYYILHQNLSFISTAVVWWCFEPWAMPENQLRASKHSGNLEIIIFPNLEIL